MIAGHQIRHSLLGSRGRASQAGGRSTGPPACLIGRVIITGQLVHTGVYRMRGSPHFVITDLRVARCPSLPTAMRPAYTFGKPARLPRALAPARLDIAAPRAQALLASVSGGELKISEHPPPSIFNHSS
ncbi:hypothetical protein PsYK624_073550 [Phanerochaete sordida]|uniref:Uncharacterized protein n=1 Tax=Phanerochaete sordida TaxID=48140 RepID=A0A9P3GAB4_9APHY|nr:hypothetical protein PsYK624_073550 [Phanerochaete sordida]